MTCTNCSGLLQLGPDRWLCAWCGRHGTYQFGPLLSNGKRWRVLLTTEPGRAEHHRPWVPVESLTHAERVAVTGGKRP